MTRITLAVKDNAGDFAEATIDTARTGGVLTAYLAEHVFDELDFLFDAWTATHSGNEYRIEVTGNYDAQQARGTLLAFLQYMRKHV